MTVSFSAQEPPAAPPTTPDSTIGTPCPPATHKPDAETRAGRAAADNEQPGTGTGGQEIRQEADAPPVLTPGERVGEPADNASQPHPTSVDEHTHPDIAANTGLDAQAPPGATPATADTNSGACCAQATQQQQAETRADRAAEVINEPGTGTGRQEIWQAADAPQYQAPGNGLMKPPTAPASHCPEPKTNVSAPTLPRIWCPARHAPKDHPKLRKQRTSLRRCSTSP